VVFFFFSSRRRHTRFSRDWSSDVCSSDLKLSERADAIGISFKPQDYPVELYSLSGKCGAQMRATITEFGPVLLSKILDLNEVQTGVMMILFKYADDKGLPVVDLRDLK